MNSSQFEKKKKKMDYLKRKVYDPLMDLLRRGLSPKTISLSLSFGIVGGLFPIPGLLQ